MHLQGRKRIITGRERVIPLAKEKDPKTNVMRILDKAKIPYTPHFYEHRDDEPFDGLLVAQKLGEDPSAVFKTLVTEGKSRNYFVFVLPVDRELDLKAAARAVGEKSVDMIPVKDIQKVTGYIRGGCSPLGMKKQFPTVIDASAETLDRFYVSAGKRGTQAELSPRDLAGLIRATFADITG